MTKAELFLELRKKISGLLPPALKQLVVTNIPKDRHFSPSKMYTLRFSQTHVKIIQDSCYDKRTTLIDLNNQTVSVNGISKPISYLQQLSDLFSQISQDLAQKKAWTYNGQRGTH